MNCENVLDNIFKCKICEVREIAAGGSVAKIQVASGQLHYDIKTSQHAIVQTCLILKIENSLRKVSVEALKMLAAFRDNVSSSVNIGLSTLETMTYY